MKKGLSLLTAAALLSATMYANTAWAANDNTVMDDVNRAYVVSVTDEGSAFTYEMIVDGQLQTFTTHNKSFEVRPGQFVHFKAKDHRIVDFTETVAVASIHEKVMSKDTAAKTLDLELQGNVQLSSDYQVFQIINGEAVPKSLSDVYVGAENVSVFLNEAGQAFQVVIDGKTPVNTMRIGIMNNGFASLDHSQFDVKSANGFQVVDKKSGQSFDIAPNSVATFTSTPLGTKLAVDGLDVYTTPDRLYAVPKDDASLLQVTTFKRAYGYPNYRGFFEITPSATAGKLNVINEVQLENYLSQVVPSEMPASFGLEALKAQSVAARTYALSDYFSNRYAKKGFHVDDSTLSQVYNNSAENSLTAQAVQETRGMIMQSNGQLVDARYYSTSGGFGAAKHEVWSDANGAFPGTPIPYLNAKSYVYDPANPDSMLNLNTSDEAALNAFYKNLSYTGYDSTSYYFRWKVGFSQAELQNTINSQLPVRYAADPNFILTKDANGNFVSKPIPAAGAGTISNLYVAKRGSGGNMMELVVEGSTGTYKIVKEYNIRFTIRPSKSFTGSTSDVLLYRAKGGSTAYDTGFTLKNYTILPSAFMTFDIARDSSGNLSSVTFFGGGNGHGVGMSQYGASSLGAMGWSFDRILNAYYAGMNMVNVYEQ
jgi:stage II sporulation protein D